jgi:NAD(P)H-dependent FMN reductase
VTSSRRRLPINVPQAEPGPATSPPVARAPLKNALDFLYHEWAYKPVGFVSYGGPSAGTRGVQMTKQIVTTLRMYPLNAAVAIPTRQHVDSDGNPNDDDTLDAAATTVLDELARTATALESLRARQVSRVSS